MQHMTESEAVEQAQNINNSINDKTNNLTCPSTQLSYLIGTAALLACIQPF